MMKETWDQKKERVRRANKLANKVERKNDRFDEGYVDIEFPLEKYGGLERPARPRWPRRRL